MKTLKIVSKIIFLAALLAMVTVGLAQSDKMVLEEILETGNSYSRLSKTNISGTTIQLENCHDGGIHSLYACPSCMDTAISQVAPEEIEKIEVIKGPYGVCYGQSFGEIANVINCKSDRNSLNAGTFNESTTSCFAVFDLAGSYNLSKSFKVNAAINNIFNKNHCEHLSWA